MRRTLFAAAVVVWAAAGVIAQDKKDVKAPNLYPLAKGTKWEYEVNANGQKLEASQEVTDVAEAKEKGKAAIATLSTTVGPQKLTEEMSADDKGVYRHSMQGQKLSTPVTALKYPVKEGDKWDAKIALAGQEADATFETKKAEKVKVAAGEYTATPVEMNIQAMGQTIKATNWYADGVGIIKQEMTLPMGITVTMELKKFTAGK
ncbi:MAG: hypothetical protein ABGY75_17085 [Gemmataceae bacterium]